MDYKPRPTVCAKKKQLQRLIRIAGLHEDWVLGFADETWWSRLAQPQMHSWSDMQGLRLRQLEPTRSDPDPKALCCYGLLRRDIDKLLLRFVDGRPVSQVTINFLQWVCKGLAEEGKKVVVLVWDNATWHKSQKVSSWIKGHNRKAKQEGGIRIIVMRLPVKSPWLNPIEPYWVHGKRAIVEPERKLTAKELISRVCDYFGCEHFEHLKHNVL